MHRFLEFQPIGSARVALRNDGSIWLIANVGDFFQIDRGSGWCNANRLRLCAQDRIRVDESEVTPDQLCGLLGVNPGQAVTRQPLTSAIPGITAPTPLSAPASIIDNARRNPGTGQIEPTSKES
jgi:hypothetical protein